MPVRKRTALVDQRVSRSSLGKDVDPQHLLELQRAQMRATSPAPRGGKDLPPIQLQQQAVPTTPSPAPALTATAGFATNPVSALGFGPAIEAKKMEEAGSDEDEPFIPPSDTDPKSSTPPAASAAVHRSSVHSANSIRSSRSEGKTDLAPVIASPAAAAAPSHETDPIPPTATTFLSKDTQQVQETEQAPTAAPADGGDVVISSGGSAAGLKRGVSGESSRLRGPRAARGPRPAPGRAHGTSMSTSERPDSPQSIAGSVGQGEGLGRVKSRPTSIHTGAGAGAGTSRPTTPSAGERPSSKVS